MTGMQFYKKRDFAELMGDTFTFFKKFGKNYFKNFFLVNGILMLILIVIMLLFYRNIMGQILGGNLQGETFLFEEYFQDNPVLLVISAVAVVLLVVAGMLVNYSFPVLYIRRLARTGNSNIKPDQIFDDIKKIIPKFLFFLLGTVFILVPAAIVLITLGSFLVLILIGVFVLLLIMPVIMNVINFTLYDTYNTNRGFFSSLSYALRAQFSYQNSNEGSPFWKYWGSTILIFLIYYIIVSVFSSVPMIFLMGSLYTLPPEQLTDGTAIQETFGLTFFIFYGLSVFVSLVLANLVFVCSALQYYDSRTDLHRRIDFEEIDTIGVREA